MVDWLWHNWWVLFFAAVAVWAARHLQRLGGIRGLLFAAKPVRELGEVVAEPTRGNYYRVRIHLLEAPRHREPLIGIEINQNAFFSASMKAAPLTRKRAKELGELLIEASELKR